MRQTPSKGCKTVKCNDSRWRVCCKGVSIGLHREENLFLHPVRLFGCLTLATTLMACAGEPASSRIQVKRVAPATVRLMKFVVRGPATLGSEGKIVSDSSAALIDDRGAVLVDAVAAWRLAPYRVLQTTGRVVPVEGATFQVQTLDGKPFSATGFTGPDGSITLRVKPNGMQLAGIAVFRAKARTYRLATLIAPGLADGDYEIDPISTLMDAVARDLVRLDFIGVQMPFSRYRRVWEILNSAGVTVDPVNLRADTPPEQAFPTLRQVWQDTIASSITTAPEQEEIRSFLDDLDPN